MSGDHRNFHVYGSCISVNRPIDVRSTCAERSHAGRRLMSSQSGRPELKPVNTQISIRRLRSASRTVSLGGAEETAVALTVSTANRPASFMRGFYPRRYRPCATNSCPASEAVYREVAKQVRQRAYAPTAGEHDPVENAMAPRGEECVEVGHRAEMDVRRVVPLIRQRARHRHAAAQDLPPMRPVPEVGERHDRLAPDAQHLPDDHFDAAHRLQRLRQHDAIERCIVEAGKAPLEVALDDVDAVVEACEHAGVGDLDAVAARLAFRAQVCKQAAVATAEVED